jgi:hypothetical protein
MSRKKHSAEKRLAEATRKAATIKAYIATMAEKGVTVTEVSWAPADPTRRRPLNTETVGVKKYVG